MPGCYLPKQQVTAAKPPRELTPAFYGCYDWHSSVHGHWLLVRLAKLYPGSDFAASARAALLRQRALAYYAQDRNCPLACEPSGEDFLSPRLGEADFMRRILPPGEYSRWLGTFAVYLTTGAGHAH